MIEGAQSDAAVAASRSAMSPPAIHRQRRLLLMVAKAAACHGNRCSSACPAGSSGSSYAFFGIGKSSGFYVVLLIRQAHDMGALQWSNA
jgi:hypothetical protein